MKKTALVYAWAIGALGVLFGAYNIVQYISGSWNLPPLEEGLEMLTLLGLFLICRSLPLLLSDDSAIDMSFIIIIACMMLKGAPATVTMIVVCTPFIFEVDHAEKNRKLFTILNVAPVKTLFNMGNPVIAVSVAGFIYNLVGGSPGSLALPFMLWPLLLFICVVICLNSSILYLLFTLNGQVMFFSSLLKDFVQLLPSWLAAAPIGYFLAFLMKMPSGSYLTLLFMLPLLLARYAFKQYLDSRKQYYSLIRTLSTAMEARDEYTQGHSLRVGKYAQCIGRAMNLTQKELDNLQHAAVLHDIGKIGIQDTILNKPGALTPEERLVIQTHPQIAINIIGDTMITPKTQEIILHHHESFDGRGYPSGSKGGEISIHAYILSAADTFDAITSDRPYRKGRPLEVAMQIIEENAGRQFHPEVVRVMLDLKDELRRIMEES